MRITLTPITITEITITTTDPDIVIRSDEIKLRPATDDSVQIRPQNILIRKGERWALTGPSGCGKTTFINALCGLLAPSSGELQVLEQDLYAMSPGQRDRFRGHYLEPVPYGYVTDT